MNPESEGPDKLLDAASQRVTASLSVYANLARLTLLEARLFASGSMFIFVVGFIAALFCLVAWLLLLSIIVVLLVDSGVSLLVALCALLLLHLVAIVVLGWLIKQQLPNLGFSHVRAAFDREFEKAAAEKPESNQEN